MKELFLFYFWVLEIAHIILVFFQIFYSKIRNLKLQYIFTAINYSFFFWYFICWSYNFVNDHSMWLIKHHQLFYYFTCLFGYYTTNDIHMKYMLRLSHFPEKKKCNKVDQNFLPHAYNSIIYPQVNHLYS